MLKSLTFNGIRKPWLYLLEGRSKAPFAPVRHNLLRVPGMPGAHIISSETDVLYITQPIGFVVKDDEHALQLKDELASWLLTDEPVPLTFDDEPGRTYYAKVEGTIEDFSKFVDQRRGTLTFLCADPYSYGPEKEATFPSDVVTLTNEGTAEADPLFELEVLQPVTFAMIQNQNDEYMMIGRPVDVENMEPVEELTSIFEHDMSNFVGWTDVITGHTWNDNLLGGVVGGQFSIGTGQWYVTDFGDNTGGWHGPSKRTSFSESLQDFQIDYSLSSLNFTGDLGKNAVILLDENDNIVASLGVVDRTPGYGYHNRTQVNLGGNTKIFDYEGFNNMNMWLRLRREGTRYTVTLYKVREDGLMYSKVIQTFEDRLGEFQAPIRQAAVYIANYKDYRVVPMYANHLKVFKVNDLPSNQIPYIADVGDIITLDHKNEDILINGEPRMDLKDFGASYFKLSKGFNQLIVHPSESFNTSVKYRERFK